MPARCVVLLLTFLVGCDRGEGSATPRCEDGAAPVLSWLDRDGDGYGDIDSESVLSCAVPAGRSATADDCNDADPLVWPGAPERCDGQLNDCSAPDAQDKGMVTIEGGESFASLQEALEAAVPGDELLVCEGTWAGSFQADVAVHLVGVAGRERTILDGQGQGRVLSLPPGSSVAGLTLTGGRAETGGGLRLRDEGSLVVRDCAIERNSARHGGGLALPEDSEVFLPGTVIRENEAVAGGGIFAERGSMLDLVGARVEHNRAELGGGVAGSALTVVGGSITHNQADRSSGAPHHHSGGGLLLTGASTISDAEIAHNRGLGNGGGIAMAAGELSLRDARLHHNTAASSGGGLALSDASAHLTATTVGPDNVSESYGGGVSVAMGALSGGEIRGNQSYAGGGVHGWRSQLGQLVVTDNTAEIAGGILLQGGLLGGTLIDGNSAGWVGGLLTEASGHGPVSVEDTLVYDNVSLSEAGGLHLDADEDNPTLLERVTVAGNRGSDGAGLSISSGRARMLDSHIFYNVATEGQGGGMLLTNAGRIEVSGCDLGEGLEDNVPADVSTSEGEVIDDVSPGIDLSCTTGGCLSRN